MNVSVRFGPHVQRGFIAEIRARRQRAIMRLIKCQPIGLIRHTDRDWSPSNSSVHELIGTHDGPI